MRFILVSPALPPRARPPSLRGSSRSLLALRSRAETEVSWVKVSNQFPDTLLRVWSSSFALILHCACFVRLGGFLSFRAQADWADKVGLAKLFSGYEFLFWVEQGVLLKPSCLLALSPDTRRGVPHHLLGTVSPNCGVHGQGV
ncbi:hypothetical protein NL676_028565 [Syzygium grande]|nr:hypothetical protein NL676_028565 [Syzygium grande]